jgi:hypothetical protein
MALNLFVNALSSASVAEVEARTNAAARTILVLRSMAQSPVRLESPLSALARSSVDRINSSDMPPPVAVIIPRGVNALFNLVEQSNRIHRGNPAKTKARRLATPGLQSKTVRLA